jgi:hypothetical protein
MEEQRYQMRIVLKGGVIEAEVTHPVIRLDAEQTRVLRLDWQNPAEKGHVSLAHLVTSIMASRVPLTRVEIS